ncbi:uncharacterized protein MONOS_11778 [Monocercomonoides exilis]|uniref:uncharacterized protein n=1 Tax=Monocercomonoides exilis TaxID=2049356 RepID=UPI003559B3EB|nr:hypothetical protein MONOS_11778 [Monocercomonoides exilis]|eukprot:MONOS_11778.1-p1 / transcript=MONOS_11778.1 / gene=MONOS_11778 / organism=Monocercomonoides_exilis_PA203 / gene_product=unspecified product / transcript_product=unspecified product / location=Mono_scaffold00610:10913-12280(+) / protein_length=456 / sequence_SO=supercontig / SO=protein_coding / is_pseudo=false
MKKFALYHNLPLALDDSRVYSLLRSSITGGLSNVMHRINIAGESHISHFHHADNTIISKNTPNIMTHIMGVDFNSLYPSAYSSIKNCFGKRMYIPWHCEFYTTKMDVLNRIIAEHDKLFIVSLKGHIKESHINKCLFFPPIIRNLTFNTNEDIVGTKMMDTMKHQLLHIGKRETKITQLISTHNQFMSFTNEHLFYMIKECGLVIDDLKEMAVFSKNAVFKTFACALMDQLVKAIAEGNKNEALFMKLLLNSSYAYDSMNTEIFPKTALLSKEETVRSQIFLSFVSSQKPGANVSTVEQQPRQAACCTCLQSAVWTLDNAKVWYLRFVFIFMMKCLNLERIHFIEGDTDSAYWSICGHSKLGINQGFDALFINREFNNKHVGYWFPGTSDVKEQKKLLGLTVERVCDWMITLSPKSYTIRCNGIEIMKNKGVNTNDNYMSFAAKVIGMDGTLKEI